MADSNELFKAFNGIIKLSDSNRNILRGVRDSLRQKMWKRFATIPLDQIGTNKIDFQTQGSYVMDTIITPYDDDFDLDDGVYFLGNLSREQRPTTKQFHDWVLFVVGEDENYAKVTDKDTCVRVRYSKEKFHIDLPIYYSNNFKSPDLAHLKENWKLSGPVEFIAWFENKIGSNFQESFILESNRFAEFQTWKTDIRKTDAQLRRIVRYLKAWADNLRGDMPPGIIMTILAGENYKANESDDVSLRDTLVNIKSYLKANGCKCPRPTTPKNEDLFESYSETKKKYFLDRLDTFVDSANQAIANPNYKEACLKWQKHLGSRFPCSMIKDEMPYVKSYPKAAVIGDNAQSA